MNQRPANPPLHKYSPRILGALAWIGCAIVIVGLLGPIWAHWNGSIVGPFGAVDAAFQCALLDWSAQHSWMTSTWRDLPIFHPTTGMIGAMDSLLGQAWLVLPWRLVADPTLAAQYNLAMLLSLILAGLATGWIVIAAGGPRWSAGIAALVLIGSPFTLSQIGHLNQLPPPFVMTSLASLLLALHRWSEGQTSAGAWWALGVSLALQSFWGWYGLAYALLGCGTIAFVWTWHHLVDRSLHVSQIRKFPWISIPSLMIAAAAILWTATPQFDLQLEHQSFTRGEASVRYYSADIQHFAHRGAYRSTPNDWFGQSVTGLDRYEGRDRHVLHPGWGALVLAMIGWLGRRRLPLLRRRTGAAMLALGFVGIVLAFGDSVGLPGTERRLTLPLSWLRDLVPLFKAYRAVWRFSFLTVIAVVWWAAVGGEMILAWVVDDQSGGRRHWWKVSVPVIILAMTTALSLPVALPALSVPFDGQARAESGNGPVLCLPSVPDPLTNDVPEAFWLARAIEIGQPVSGGATGWRPQATVELHQHLQECESGDRNGVELLTSMRNDGFMYAEIVDRMGDEIRMDYWRSQLRKIGATPMNVWPRKGYETWLLP